MSAAARPDRPNPPFVSGETSRVATNMGESSNEFLYRPGELVISNTDEARSALAELVGGDYEAVESELDEVGLLLVHLKADPVALNGPPSETNQRPGKRLARPCMRL